MGSAEEDSVSVCQQSPRQPVQQSQPLRGPVPTANVPRHLQLACCPADRVTDCRDCVALCFAVFTRGPRWRAASMPESFSSSGTAATLGSLGADSPGSERLVPCSFIFSFGKNRSVVPAMSRGNHGYKEGPMYSGIPLPLGRKNKETQSLCWMDVSVFRGRLHSRLRFFVYCR